MAERGISLTRYSEQLVRMGGRGQGEGFRLRIVARHHSLMPTEIFVHQRRLVNPRTGAQGDEFVCVCSPIDLTAYPAIDPDPLQSPAFFRLDTVDVIIPTQALLEETWELIKADVCHLVDTLNRMDTLVEQDTIRCGGDLTDTESFSTSMSTSVSMSVSQSES